MNDIELRSAIARSIYWGYMKDTTGTPGKWSTLGPEERKIWNNAAKRALAKLAEVAAAAQPEGEKSNP